MLADQTIQDILRGEQDPQLASDRLVDAANRAGGDDNITAIVVDVLQEGEAPDQMAEPALAVPVAPAGDPAPASPSTRPQAPRPKHRRRALAWKVAPVLIALLIGAWIGVRTYVNQQWYVGQAGGRVAIYHGVPTTILGLKLHHVVETTDLPAAGAEGLQPWADIAGGITADSFRDAESILDQIRQDLASSATGSSG